MKTGKFRLFFPEMKMSDLVEMDYRLLAVLSRLGYMWVSGKRR